MTVDQKITLLNEKLSEVNVKAVIVPTNDAHFSEYVSSYDKCREFISGFTGSAGTCVISHSGSVLWSDSRYFLQAEDELKSTTIQFMKSGVEGVPTIEQWLKSHLNEGDSVGFDAKLFSVEQVAELQNKLLPLKLQAINDPFDSDVWPSRPLPPTAPVEPMEVSVAGESSESKLLRLREMLSLNDGESYVVSMLDEIAWICNIRGGDVDYNPVVISYLIVESNKAVLFVDKQKVNSRTEFILNQSSIYVMEYSDFDDYIAQNASNTYMLNPSKSSYHTRSLIKNIKFESGPTAISLLKSQKNETEIKGFKQAMIEDGVALVKFYMWLEESLQKGDIVGEWDLSCKLIEFRSQSPLYRGESFTPIVGYKDNGAIVHYSVTPQSSKTITRDGFLLIDSGGQYSCGTTDITRTLHLSFTPTEQECIDFTLVLKGNLSLSMAIFPKGTRGSQLDILARKDMYSYGINYMHGTSHGVGHYLNVHEGPQSIRKEENSVTIKPLMVMSNEPGIYRTGEYGIRTENVIISKEYQSTEFGDFLCFEAITLFPIDLKCIKIDMLSIPERSRLNDYHSRVYDKLSPRLSQKEKLWLALKTKAI